MDVTIESSISDISGLEESTIFKIYKAYIMENNMPDIIQILLDDEINVHYSVVTDCTALLKLDMTFANLLFFESEKALGLLDKALASTCMGVYKSHSQRAQMTLKPNVHARIKNIPTCPELWRDRIPKSQDIGKFLAVEGTVIRTSSVKLLEYQKDLRCTKCKSTFSLEADFRQYYKIPTPPRCPANSSCTSKKFVTVQGESAASGRRCKDFQEIRIQEQVRRLAMGTIPRTITVVLEDDLVDGCKAGDDVVVYGPLRCRWRPLITGKPCDLETVMKANYIEVRSKHQLGASVKEEMQNDFECFWAAHADNPLTARNHILASLCPQVYGLYVVKLAVALVLAGGVARIDSSGSRIRGEAHMLLVGDPGTGKSQFLKYASKVSPRSVLTTGIGSTTAGLTVTAVRDGPQWTLEAGALVLSDGGICCIDEFSSIKEHDIGAIHEAMEQQTVSVAKAGLVCKLNTRTSVLAATNPKLGTYDESTSMELNVAIPSPLLSRFDLVLVLIDGKDERWDSVIADYVLTGIAPGENNGGKQKLWSMDQMQAYFSVVRQINPTLTPAANKILSEYYRCHRRADFRNAARTTIRLLESLIRLAEAHARLTYKQTVEIPDAVAAITLMESSMAGASLLPTGSVLHTCFPVNAEEEHERHTSLVLDRLGLGDLLKSDAAISVKSEITTPKINGEANAGKNILQKDTGGAESFLLASSAGWVNECNSLKDDAISSADCNPFNLSFLDKCEWDSSIHASSASSDKTLPQQTSVTSLERLTEPGRFVNVTPASGKRKEFPDHPANKSEEVRPTTSKDYSSFLSKFMYEERDGSESGNVLMSTQKPSASNAALGKQANATSQSHEQGPSAMHWKREPLEDGDVHGCFSNSNVSKLFRLDESAIMDMFDDPFGENCRDQFGDDWCEEPVKLPGRSSHFTLDPTAVEEICGDLSCDKENLTKENF